MSARLGQRSPDNHFFFQNFHIYSKGDARARNRVATEHDPRRADSPKYPLEIAAGVLLPNKACVLHVVYVCVVRVRW
jgi:hypothetical protein